MQARILIVSGRKKRDIVLNELLEKLEVFGVEAEVFGVHFDYGKNWVEENFSIALIDLDEITYGGYDPFATLAEITSKIPSVLVSERGSLEKWARALESGAVSFVTRPLDADTLARSILRIITRNINK